MPPTVSRGGAMAHAPTGGVMRKKARRRLNIPLAAAGAEVRLPAMPVIRVGWRVVSGMMVVAVLLALYALWTAPQFQVDFVGVKGLERLTSQDINMVLDVAGSPIFAVRPSEVLEKLQTAYPELMNARVRVGFPAKVVVEAGERVPVLAWDQAGLTLWVDAEGISFYPHGQVEDLVSVKAVDSPKALPGEEEDSARLITPQMVRAILKLSEQMPEGSTLLYSLRHGLGWVDPQGWEIYFGPDPKDVDQRLAVYNGIVEEMKRQGISPVLISLEYLHAPYYRLER